MMQFDRPQGPPSRPRSVNLPLLIIVICVMILAFYIIQRDRGGFFTPDAEPRAVTPRGDLAADEQSTIELFEHANPSVVYITSLALQRDFFQLNPREIPQGTGSGFLWDREGHIVTNLHVVASALRSGKLRIQLADRTDWDATIVGYDRLNDLAVLHIDAPSNQLKPIPIGTSEDLRVGQKVFAIGNPFGFDHSLTTGVVSALDREVETDAGIKISGLIQTDADINPGNSGGPLLDSAGRLIGVNTAIVSRAGSTVGSLGFAIPVDTVNAIVPQILRAGTAPRAGLGIIPFTDQTTRRLGFQEGVMIKEVQKGSAAEAAGLRSARIRGVYFLQGDLIVAIDGEKIVSRMDLHEVLGRREVGDVVEITFMRGGEWRSVKVMLQKLD